MWKLILLDLDDTLLDTKIYDFLPHYFSALGEKLKHILPSDEMIDLVLKATKHMMRDLNPNTTNAEAFAEYFFPRLPVSREEIEPQIAEFYEQNFPALKKHVKAIPLTKEFVTWLFNHDFNVAIATNPLFPARAIEHRIDWAGILDFPYCRITTYENSHYSKPNPKYYQEILDTCGVQAIDALMVGDDMQNDIIPARAIGMQTYHINTDKKIQGKSGSLTDCFEWIKSNN
jgi:FMN phosphatase YigB (HAD superfamily)